MEFKREQMNQDRIEYSAYIHYKFLFAL